MSEAPWQKSLEYLAYQWYLAIGGTAGVPGEATWQKSLNYWLWQIAVIYGDTSTHWNMPVEYWLYRIYVLNGGTAINWQKPAEYWARLIYGQLTATTPIANFNLEYWLYQIGQSATPPFDPASIPWAYWYKTDGLVGLNNNDPIPSLLDFSINLNHALQPTGSKRALYGAAVQNNLPVALLDGNDDFYAFTTVIPQVVPLEVWAVVETFGPDGYRALVNRDGASGLAPAIYISTVGAGLGKPTIYWANSFSGGAASEFNSSHSTVNGQYFIARFRITNVGGQIVGITIDNNAEETAAYVSSNFTNWDLISYTTTQFYRRGLAELAITSGYALTPDEITGMLAYLNAKWGIF